MNLKASLLATIAFFDLFDFPLTAEEIKDYLYGYDKPVHIKEIKGTLKEMAEAGVLDALKDHHVLAGRTKLLEIRKARRFIAEKFWNRATLYAKTMQRIPFVRMAAVCNNLAYDNTDEGSDIDLFVVTEPGHVWTARFFLTAALHFFGVRRHGKKTAGRFCLSFFVTTENLDMGPLQIEPEDPYLAYWTKTLTPVYGETVYADFQKQNAGWLKRSYGLVFSDFPRRHLYCLKESLFKHFLERIFGNWFETLLQKTLKKKTLAAQAKLGPAANVVVTDSMLKFHNHDRRREFFETWKKTMADRLS